jgi:ABC-2 type transport system ATP-binding protein
LESISSLSNLSKVIEIRNLTKRFSDKLAVDDLSFGVADGSVTGFVGANGAGKTTTLRCALQLCRPDRGQVTIDGHSFVDLAAPEQSVGALIDTKVFHKSRQLQDHLWYIARSAGLPIKRVDEVIDLTGLTAVARKRLGAFSMGMTQRANIAVALLGKPRNLILDEPVNGLDPEGIVWVRQLCQGWAEQGNAVLISSHLMSELEHTIDRVVIIGRGRKLAEGSLEEIVRVSGADNLENAYLQLTRSETEFRSKMDLGASPTQPSTESLSESVYESASQSVSESVSQSSAESLPQSVSESASQSLPQPVLPSGELKSKTSSTPAVPVDSEAETELKTDATSPAATDTESVSVDKQQWEEFVKWKEGQR